MHVATNADAMEWTAIHGRIERLAREARAVDFEIGRWLLLASREAVHRKLGLSTFAEYADRVLGYDVHTTRERLRVAEALERLPLVRDALESGRRSWSIVRELTRVASPDNEAAWLEHSEGMTVRQIEALVRGRAPGDSPNAPKDPLLASRRLVFELPPEDWALVMEAFEHVREEIGMRATQVEVLRTLAEIALGKRMARDAAYRVTLTVCAACSATHQRAGGEHIEVAPEVADCARCDGKVVGFAVDERDSTSHVGLEFGADESGSTSPVGREFGSGERDSTSHVGRGLGTDGVASASHVGRGRDSDGVASVCDEGRGLGADETKSTSHVGRALASGEIGSTSHVRRGSAAIEALRQAVQSNDGSARALLSAATRAFGLGRKTVTPAMRELVLARDGGRCVVFGCRCFRRVDLHHLDPRANGGPHAVDNLVTLCDTHHRLLHQGSLAIEVSDRGGVVVRHARGTLIGLRGTSS